MIRRIDTDEDRGCFVDAWAWEVLAPRWFRDADKVFGPPTLEDFIQSSGEDNRATFGIFENDLIGIIILTLRGNGIIEADLMAKPGCSPFAILEGAIGLRDRIFEDLGAREIMCWLAKKNIPTRRLCCILGFRETGITLIRGTHRDRVIEWINLSVSREAWEAKTLKAA